jgi:hypothetical protein
MFIEIIDVYCEITAEYINTFCKQNSESLKVVANDTYMHLCGLNLDNISLVPTHSFGKN